MRLLRCGVYLAFALGAPFGIEAQLLQGTLDGNIADSTQAAIAGASITATDAATGFSRGTTANTSGFYSLSGLPPGVYNVNVNATGLQASTHTGVSITAQTVTRLDVTLNIGSVNETVTVSAQAAELQADRADVHAELGAKTLQNVPVPIGRNYQMIFTTIPIATNLFGATGTQLDWAGLQNVAADAPALVAKLNRVLMHNSMSPDAKNAVITAVNGIAATDTLLRARTAFYLVATSSQYQVER